MDERRQIHVCRFREAKACGHLGVADKAGPKKADAIIEELNANKKKPNHWGSQVHEDIEAEHKDQLRSRNPSQ